MEDKLKLELQQAIRTIGLVYRWRQLGEKERSELLTFRRQHFHPWHSPPHWKGDQSRWLLTAACYEHQRVIGTTIDRMQSFVDQLHTHQLSTLLNALGKLHGRTSRYWNVEDKQRGRKVWFNCAETAIKSDRHYWATLNYIHHNPVRHGYVKHWQDWPFSSAVAYLEKVGREAALRTWKAYPVLDYGKDWDRPDL